MKFTEAQLLSLMTAYMWPFMRIGAMLMAAPIFGSQSSVPVRVRLLFAIAITVVIVPLLPAPPAVNPFSAIGFMIMVQQVLIGFAMGFIMQMVFSALVIGGHSIAMSMGLGFASFIDPQNGVSVPVVSKFYIIIGTLLFLSFNGHLVMIQVLHASFESLPVGPVGLNRGDMLTIALWGARMFAGALLVALPALITIKLINIAFGVMTRAAPTLNIFGVGFPTTMFAGFVVMFLTLPNLLPRFTELVMDAFDLMQAVIKAN